RDRNVTGVQTCALPICSRGYQRGRGIDDDEPRCGASLPAGVGARVADLQGADPYHLLRDPRIAGGGALTRADAFGAGSQGPVQQDRKSVVSGESEDVTV